MKLLTYSPADAAVVRPFAWLLLAHTMALLLAPAIAIATTTIRQVQP